MSAYRQPGDVLTIPAPVGGVIKGRVYLVGVLALVALNQAVEGEQTTFAVGGVWELPKATGVSFTTGELAFYDVSSHEVNKTAAGRVPIGAVIDSTDTTATVRMFAQSTAVMQ